MQHRERRPHGCSYQTEGSTSIEFSTAKGNLEREREVDDTMLDLLQPFTEGLEDVRCIFLTPTAWSEVVEEHSHGEKLPSVATDGERHSGKRIKSRKGIIGSQPRGTHNVFDRHPKYAKL